MTDDLLSAPVLARDEPAGLTARGTLIVLAGRGESASVYARFASRLASDAYRVRVIGDVTVDLAATEQRIGGLLADGSLPSPRVLVGSDAGSSVAIRVAAAGAPVDAVVLAGLAVADRPARGIGDEIERRTSCPTHGALLARASELRRGAVDEPLPADLRQVDVAAVPVPVLALHGEDDAISPLADALVAYKGAVQGETVTIVGGKHDVLNDATHRTVAATIVLFLERLRLGPDLPPIARAG